jgi:hypothetical protein
MHLLLLYYYYLCFFFALTILSLAYPNLFVSEGFVVVVVVTIALKKQMLIGGSLFVSMNERGLTM